VELVSRGEETRAVSERGEGGASLAAAARRLFEMASGFSSSRGFCLECFRFSYQESKEAGLRRGPSDQELIAGGQGRRRRRGSNAMRRQRHLSRSSRRFIGLVLATAAGSSGAAYCMSCSRSIPRSHLLGLGEGGGGVCRRAASTKF